MKVVYFQSSLNSSHLKQNSIDTGIHYSPHHHHTYFNQFVKGPLPTADIIAEQIVTIPLFVDMSKNQLQSVIDSIQMFDKAY